MATSSEVKRKYNRKVYKKLTIEMKKEFYEMLDQYSKETGESKTSFICRMIKEHLCEKPPANTANTACNN